MFSILIILAAICCMITTAYQVSSCSRPSIPKLGDSKQLSRKKINNLLVSSVAVTLSSLVSSKPSNGFEGGVGGLGKTKPQTNVIFANPDMIETNIITPGDYNAELIAPDGRPIFLSFFAPWPMLKSQGIESRDLANPESSFVQVSSLPKNYVKGNPLTTQFFMESIFGPSGKFGMYGSPSDVKIRKLDSSENKNDLYVASFTTLTPAMRESDRKAYISANVIGGGVCMLITGTTTSRWKTQEPLLRKTAESFICAAAPQSSFRR